MASKVHNKEVTSHVCSPSHEDPNVVWGEFRGLYLGYPDVGNLYRQFFCCLGVVTR